jgi:hypothetical protein
MNREDVIQMVREVWGPDSENPWSDSALAHLEQFAALVKKEWVGLTEEQLEQMWEADTTSPEDCDSLYYYKKIARQVEAKLKERNICGENTCEKSSEKN